MSDITYLIILRLVHLVCGIFWAGSIMYMAFFIQPAAKAAGPEGSKFVQTLAKTNKLPVVMMLAAILTIAAGTLLFWEISDGFQPVYMGSKHGIILSVGGTLAIIAFFIGFFVNKPTVTKIAKIGQAIAAQGGPPTAEQSQQLAKLRNKLFTGTNIIAGLLVITVILMSIVRYF
jgi:uncharacterized membrane protein